MISRATFSSSSKTALTLASSSLSSIPCRADWVMSVRSSSSVWVSSLSEAGRKPKARVKRLAVPLKTKIPGRKR